MPSLYTDSFPVLRLSLAVFGILVILENFVVSINLPSRMRPITLKTDNIKYTTFNSMDDNPFILPPLTVDQDTRYGTNLLINETQLLEYNRPDSLLFQGFPQPSSRKPVLFARFVSWILKKVIESRLKSSDGLEINVLSDSNKAVIRGKVETVELKVM